MKTSRNLAPMLLASLLLGCSQDSRVPQLEARIAGLEKQLEDIETRLRVQAEIGDWDSIAYLTPGSDGYSVIKMDLGHLTVNLANIAPYANGSKVSLVFGNLTSATIDGLKAKIEWGAVDDKGMPNNKDAKSREVKLVESLSPGAWNKTDVVLEGVAPTSLGFVRVREVGHQSIRLRGRAE